MDQKRILNTIKLNWIIIILSVGMVFFVPRISQDILYHNFADQRLWLFMPNAMDTLSNLAFIFVGIINCIHAYRVKSLPWAVAWIMLVWVGIGSGFYHVEPNNMTLVVDRLFMAIFIPYTACLVIAHHLKKETNIYLGLMLTVFGVGSVLYWGVTEIFSQGDLRFYGLIQFLPIIITVITVIRHPCQSNIPLMSVLVGYTLAKVCEHYDHQIYYLIYQVISGHTLKHIFAAIAVYPLKWYHTQKVT